MLVYSFKCPQDSKCNILCLVLNWLMNRVPEKVNKQTEVINEAEVDSLCGRNWAEDPIQGNSDLWVITSNVLRQRAVSGSLSDSISPTQRGAVHSLCLNCPICFPLDAQLFLQPFPPLRLLQQRQRDNHMHVNSFTRSSSVRVTNKCAFSTQQSLQTHACDSYFLFSYTYNSLKPAHIWTPRPLWTVDFLHEYHFLLLLSDNPSRCSCTGLYSCFR